MSQSLFIEATTSNGYEILWRETDGNTVDLSFGQALLQMSTLETACRIELWSKAHAESEGGFAPLAFREKNSRQVRICGTLKMLAGL